MRGIEGIGGIRVGELGNNPSLKAFEGTDASGESSFGKMLSDSVGEVNQLLQESDRLSTEMVSGRKENIHEAMIASEKAETSLKFMVQMRNKVIEAYNEILRMPL